METVKMHSKNTADKNYEILSALFPQAVTETIVGYDENGEPLVERAIDVDVLRKEISCPVVDQTEERYAFTWPGKKQAALMANTPVSAALRPCREESVDFDSTKNLYIEGENLDVLKLLQETYLGKIKLIYIDPPYNTGSDFIYDDDFAEDARSYRKDSGQFDAEGKRLVQNLESNGRFHTNWLNMIYPRLKLSRSLLTDDGVIFISIDDYEVENLRKAADEIFGEKNFLGTVIWERAFAPKNDAKYFSSSHDYILAYAKNKASFTIGKLPRTEEADSRYKNRDNDPRGPWTSGDLSVKTYNANTDYPITTPGGRVVNPPSGACWRVSRERFEELVADNRIYFGKDGNNVPRLKRFLSELKEGMTPTTLWKHQDVGHNQEGRHELKKIFGGKGYFDGPKPVRLLERILQIANLETDSVVLDFFSGSGTTAQAVMEYNEKNGTQCSYIMVQLPEKIKEKSAAYRDGYRTICELGRERIRRAGKKILDERNSATKGMEKQAAEIDVGFRALKLDDSNMKDVWQSPEEFSQQSLDALADNIKEDRTPEDLLFQAMLELGVRPSSSIETLLIGGQTVFSVQNGMLVACFDRDLSEETVEKIAKMRPQYAVFRDSGMSGDSVAANLEQVFAASSPETIRRVL